MTGTNPAGVEQPSTEIGHTHSDLSGGWLRPAVFGAMDGLVTNISLVAGVGGGGASPRERERPRERHGVQSLQGACRFGSPQFGAIAVHASG